MNAFFILPKFFKNEILKYSGLQFEYTKIFEKKYNLSGEQLEKETLENFKNSLIDVNKLI